METLGALSQSESQVKIIFPWKPVRHRRPPTDRFFLEGNILCRARYKQLAIEKTGEDDSWDDSDSEEKMCFPCPVNTCGQTFTSVSEYEMHYHGRHKHICSVCQRFFPTAHLLDLHLSEWHDAMFDLKAKSTAMYQCWVETCSEKFHTGKARKNHAITVHNYPANFRFDKVRKTKRNSCNTPKSKDGAKDSKDASMETKDTALSETSVSTMETEFQGSCTSQTKETRCNHGETTGADDSSISPPGGAAHPESMDHTSGDQSQPEAKTSRFVYKKSVPKTICFGHGSQRTFQHRGRGAKHKHWHQRAPQSAETKVNIEDVQMNDLTDALVAS